MQPLIWDPHDERMQPTWKGQMLRRLAQKWGADAFLEHRSTFPWDLAIGQAWRGKARPWFLTTPLDWSMALRLRLLRTRLPITLLLGEWPTPKCCEYLPGSTGWVPHEQAANAWVMAGWPRDRLVIVPPQDEPMPLPSVSLPATDASSRRSLDWILWAGRMHADDGLRKAIWTFCIVHYARPQTRLAIIGQGLNREDRQRFTRQSRVDAYVRWLEVADLAALVPQVQLVWSTDAQECWPLHAFQARLHGIPLLALERQRESLTKSAFEWGLNPNVQFLPKLHPTEWARASKQWLERSGLSMGLDATKRSCALTSAT